VVTASSSADQGVMNGAGIHVQIKGGTNSFHGSAYLYNENNALKAKPYFQPAGTKKPKYIDNGAGETHCLCTRSPRREKQKRDKKKNSGCEG
jgi:hypothetical protein